MRPVSMIRPSTREAGAAYVSKTDMVAALIRELIITGELTTGEQLRQRDLAQRFGVSQTPVRCGRGRRRGRVPHPPAHHGGRAPAWPLAGAAAWPAWVTRKRGDEVTR